jgi:O-acetyl-ADP-ribose deacetylase (regulator of RNase III)
MSRIQLIHGSCADQVADVVVNAANDGLWAGGGICGVIFAKAGMRELTEACSKYKTPLNDGDAVITPAFGLTNAKAIIHAVGPNFAVTPTAFDALFDAYYNSLVVLMENGYHSISFPLISAGIFGGNLEHPAAESTKQCLRAYRKFVEDHPDYEVDVRLCAFAESEMAEATKVFDDGKESV